MGAMSATPPPPADLEALLAYDRAHVWHPYSSALAPQDPYVVESAEGVRLRLRDRDGTTREVVDAMSSWWCAVHGYRVPELDTAVRDQLDSMAHVMFGGLTHAPAVGLARRLVEIAPAGLEHVFLADSGSVSVEVAMKMALQWHLAAGDRRTRFLTIRGGYHGDTFSPMSVTDPDGGMHALFRGVLPEHVFAPRPPAGVDRAPDDPDLAAWEHETRALFAAHAADVAAVIVEPVLQGAGGMHVWPAHALAVLHELAREHGALVIHDEIATGLHRTGPLWAGARIADPPDILCTGKSLTGRLPQPGGRAVHAAGGRGREPWRGRGAHARPHLHGQPAGVRRRVGQPRPARRRGTPPARWAGSRTGCGRGWSRPPAWGRWRTSACSAPSAWCSCTSRSGSPR